jgi:hypothetical protein
VARVGDRANPRIWTTSAAAIDVFVLPAVGGWTFVPGRQRHFGTSEDGRCSRRFKKADASSKPLRMQKGLGLGEVFSDLQNEEHSTKKSN